MGTLIQKNIINRRVFELTEKGLEVKEQSLFNSSEYNVDYDDIGTKRIKKQIGKNGWLIASIFFFILTIGLYFQRVNGGQIGNGAEIFWLITGVVCLTIYFWTYKKVLFLTRSDNTNSIEFILNKPSKKDVDEFVDNLIKKRNEMLRSKYGKINMMLAYDENYGNLMYLYNQNVFSKTEFDQLIEELNIKFKYTGNSTLGMKISEN